MGAKEFQQENNELLKFILTERFFKPWKNGKILIQENEDTLKEIDAGLYSSSGLELYLTSSCNQKCEYCYLAKYENKLYPQHLNNENNIINNLKIILEWIIENDFSIPSMDLFTGEIWHSDFGLLVLDTILSYLDKGLDVKRFIIPSNMSFIHDEDQICRIQQRIDKAKQLYNAYFIFSASIDGKYCDDGRPSKNNLVNDDAFYERLFLFCQYNQFFFHPMISATNVFNWKENYLWWKEQCKEYNFIFHKAIMNIEVRNDDWTEEAIKAREDLEEFIFNDYFDDVCHKDLDLFTKHCFASPDRFIQAEGYNVPTFPIAYTFPGCTVADHLTIRVGDLAIVPCHRTAYDKFIYGYFKVEDNRIVDIYRANNVRMAMKIYFMNNTNTNYECDICNYADYCTKGCFGAQYEYTGDPFIPCKSVCNMIKRKIKKRISLYEQFGVIDKIKELTEFDREYEYAQHFLKMYDKIKHEVNPYAKMA